MLELADLTRGMRILDLATGRGEPAVPAAQRVGPTGSVVGVDVSETMLEMAQQRALKEGIHNLTLLVDDATHLAKLPRAEFDVVLCRWGLMYFPDPLQALRAARRCCAPTGRLVVALWAEPERVDYVHVPRSLLKQVATLPEIQPDQPGTFRFADRHIIERDLAESGWTIKTMDEIYTPVMQATTPEELVHWCECFGMNRLLQDMSTEVRTTWRNLLRQHFPKLCNQPGMGQPGIAYLGGITRIVVATSTTAQP